MQKNDQKKVSVERAIKLVCENYGHALTTNYIRKPVAWALYQTWRIIDREEKPRHLEGGRHEE